MSVVGNGIFSERGGPKARNRLSTTATASARARHDDERMIVAPVASTMAARRCVHCSSNGANAASASSFAVRCVGGPGGARPPNGARTPSMSRKMSGFLAAVARFGALVSSWPWHVLHSSALAAPQAASMRIRIMKIATGSHAKFGVGSSAGRAVSKNLPSTR